MRREQAERRTDDYRRKRALPADRQVSLRTLIASCAVLCGLMLAVAYGAAAIGDRLEPRVSLPAAAGGFDALVNGSASSDETLALALTVRPPAHGHRSWR